MESYAGNSSSDRENEELVLNTVFHTVFLVKGMMS